MFASAVAAHVAGLLPDVTTIGVSLLSLSLLLYGFWIIYGMVYRTHHGGLGPNHKIETFDLNDHWDVGEE